MTDHRNIEPWSGLPSGARRALLQARAALVGPVADGQSRRCAVATIDQTLADDAQAREIEALRAALERIARWHGEFPATGKVWQDGTPTSYGAENGSNGERDFMRQVALDALAGPVAPSFEAGGLEK